VLSCGSPEQRWRPFSVSRPRNNERNQAGFFRARGGLSHVWWSLLPSNRPPTGSEFPDLAGGCALERRVLFEDEFGFLGGVGNAGHGSVSAGNAFSIWRRKVVTKQLAAGQEDVDRGTHARSIGHWASKLRAADQFALDNRLSGISSVFLRAVPRVEAIDGSLS
jgi:hypothetical protein